MCGIVGHINLKAKLDKPLFETMLSTLQHRGPDGKGTYFSKDQKKALGHHRLSFLDLTEKGAQPYGNKTGNCWVTFNGEIYNYLELRSELKDKYSFISHTDTEVILAAYTVWGIDFIKRLKGMFAIGILDEANNKLHLIRDRFGIKPLYYGIANNQLVFASELKAIMASKVFPKEIDKSAVADYFVYRYIPSPKTIWQNIKKLPPANYINFNLSDLKGSVKTYWEPSASNNDGTIEELVKDANQILTGSVKQHLRADTPIGAFLSGGYDSSALALWMKQQKKPPKTFSIGFENWEKSEHYYAKTVADYLELTNKAVIADQSSLKLVDKMPIVYDEPIADISIVPTFMVSKLARESVKAVFSGEGADEIFGGYTWQHDYNKLLNPKSLKDKLKKIIQPKNPINFYAKAMAMGWYDFAELKEMLHPNLHSSIPEDVHWFYKKNYREDLSPFKAIQHLDMKCFMGELVLTKVDRASMANSLEVRVPFLDHELFEKLFSVNEKLYIDEKQTKKVLFETIKNDLPKEILDRKKQGFVGPDAYYMNLEYYKRELNSSNLVKYEIINAGYLEKALKDTYSWKLWKILILEKWFTYWVANETDKTPLNNG